MVRSFVRAELKLYRARLFSRLDEARNAIILAVIALSLVQAVMVAALVGLLIVLRPVIGPGGATAVVVVAGLALAGCWRGSAGGSCSRRPRSRTRTSGR